MKFPRRVSSALFPTAGIFALIFGAVALRSETFLQDMPGIGYAKIETSFGNNSVFRAGDTRSVWLTVGTYGNSFIDYGTSVDGTDEVVSGPWWLNYDAHGLTGDLGPEEAVVRWINRGSRLVYLHVTFAPSYAEANPGNYPGPMYVNVHGCWSSFAALPGAIQQGGAFTATATGQDDDGQLASVAVQYRMNGGSWITLGGTGGGNGWSSTTPGSTVTAGSAGTTYQFRTWSIDNNGYQSAIITSNVYTTEEPPPVTNYVNAAGVDLGNLFRSLNGAAKAAPTGITCVISGTTYDLSDLFLPRTSAAQANLGYVAANGSDITQVFEKK